MCESCGYNNKLFWPLTLVFVGVFMLLINLGMIPSSVWKIWPIVLVVVGLIGLTSGCDQCNVMKRAGKTNTSKKKKK